MASRSFHSFNLILWSICLICVVAVTVSLVVLIWGNEVSDTVGRSVATAGMVLVASLLGVAVNAITARRWETGIGKVCWASCYFFILSGLVIGIIAVWVQDDNEDILAKTALTVMVLFCASLITTAVAGAVSNSQIAAANADQT